MTSVDVYTKQQIVLNLKVWLDGFTDDTEFMIFESPDGSTFEAEAVKDG